MPRFLDLVRPLMRAAAGKLAPAPQPKVKNKQVSIPSYLTSAEPGDSALPQRDRRTANTDLTTIRTQASTRDVIREFAAVSPDLSAAVHAYIRTAVTDSYTVMARNTDGTFNRDATSLAFEILARWDVLGNYDDGFSGIWSMRSISESLIKEFLLYGAGSFELVLDKARLPRTLAPITVTKIQFKPDTKIKGLKPIQRVGSEDIDLDIPTFFYGSIDQDLTAPYADSPLESAIQPVLFAQEFMNDLRRIVKRAIHPRVSVTVDEEKFRKAIPMDVAADPAKLKTYMDTVLGTITTVINGLRPEDAIVLWDSVKCEYMNNGNQSLDAEYRVLQGIVDAKVATGAKALPSILGHGSGSQNVASSETLLFMKNANGFQQKLNELYSKALTLAVRLFGQDVVVEFRYAPIDLRPETELEAWKVMRQSRVLEQLSLGFIEDDEASIQLTGRVTPAGFKTLKGTGFFSGAAAVNPNPASNTANGNGGPRTGKPQTPQQPKGPAKAEVEVGPDERMVAQVAEALAEVRSIAQSVRVDAGAGAALRAAVDGLQAQVLAIRADLAEDAGTQEVEAQLKRLSAGLLEAFHELSDQLDERSQAAAVQLAEVSGRVDALLAKSTEIVVESPTLSLNLTNEAAKPGARKFVGKRGPNGEMQLEEVSDGA